MKTNAILFGLLVSGLIGLSGCDQGAAPAKQDEKKTSQTAPNTSPAVAATSAERPTDASNLVFVKLNVPNMT